MIYPALPANFNSPLANGLLKELAAQNPNGEVGRLAAAALNERVSSERE